MTTETDKLRSSYPFYDITCLKIHNTLVCRLSLSPKLHANLEAPFSIPRPMFPASLITITCNGWAHHTGKTIVEILYRGTQR